MTEIDYINKLEASWPRDCDATLEAIELADESVRTFPKSARLWCIRGDLIQLSSENCPHSLADARDCYQRATEIAPKFIEAWESLGHFHNAVLDDETTAQKFFREAERLRGT